LFDSIDSHGALQLLIEGNRRYVTGKSLNPMDYSQARVKLAEIGQHPFAVILGCSDSRVPPEIVFDVGIGQLFVVRTAGNIADAIAVGSVEYAVQHLHTPLVVVLGHHKCGAIAAALYGGDNSPNIGAIIREIQPSLEKTRSVGELNIASRCEDENTRHTVSVLHSSQIISRLIDSKKLLIIGAMYDMETGEVNFEID
jgi:carbonic anhydrase